MLIDGRFKDLKSLHPTNDTKEEKVESFEEKPAEETIAGESIEETTVPVDVLEEGADDFDGWNAEDDDDELGTEQSDAPVTEPRKTLMQILKESTANGDLNPALQVTLSIAPIFQDDRPYKLTYNNISDDEFREMFWSSYEHEVVAICVEYSSGSLAFITGYHSFLGGIETKSFYVTTADIDKYDIRFTPYCTYAEAVNEYKSTLAKEEAEKEKEK